MAPSSSGKTWRQEMAETLIRMEEVQKAMRKEMQDYNATQNKRVCDIELVLHGDERAEVIGLAEKQRNTEAAVKKMEQKWITVIGIVSFVFMMLADVLKAWAVAFLKMISIKGS